MLSVRVAIGSQVLDVNACIDDMCVRSFKSNLKGESGILLVEHLLELGEED